MSLPTDQPSHAATRLLVANRGEIARRIMRTCRRLGIETVAVFSDADAHADFVRDADYAVALGGNTPAESYLRGDAIIAAAMATGADAIHPGYGFLAENAEFARGVGDAGLLFIGPTPEAIASMGSKIEAKRLMADAGVPLLPSVELTAVADADLSTAVADIPYPVLIKASAGGGGRGMRIVPDAAALIEAVTGARREAGSAFGDDTIYAERYVSPSRHIEVQIFGDEYGRVIHLHERECSIQRRHQKIIEEAPATNLEQGIREALHDAAVKAGAAIGYTNAGTVEFLLAPDGAFYFLEVNTRLQVEHPVTEAVMRLDLVELQLAVAAGGPLPEQSQIPAPQGHAIEARLYAEDPTQDFLPSTGTVHELAFDDVAGLRVDTAIDPRDDAAAGGTAGEVSQYYDPMIAKVICFDANRSVAARRLATGLATATIDGVTTNRALLVRTLRHPEFLGTQGDSDFLVRHSPAELGRPLVEGRATAAYGLAAALALQAASRAAARHTPAVSSGFRNVPTEPQTVSFLSADVPVDIGYRLENGALVDARCGVGEHSQCEPVEAKLFSATATRVDLAVDGIRQTFSVSARAGHVTVTGAAGSLGLTLMPRFTDPVDNVEPGSLVASMPGTIVAVNVAAGDTVAAGDVIVVMEAMKMELSVTAPVDGTVATLNVATGDTVAANATLAIIT